eukprot:TRINITY_DN11989_c0_g1_i23.p1 TRINITY_DN11989_c0_g1~~TRINITY_DN11989_c0_g1_i23.p1  ORF type:complete len:958 (+),score=121.48 TRINITY_DN11989_c0_g1_i23:303-2876(+)
MLLGHVNVPQVGYSATSPVLSNRRLHPFYSRVVPSDDKVAAALVAMFRHFGWTKFAMITADDDFGVGGLEHLYNTALINGWEVLSIQRVPSNMALSRDPANNSIRQLEAIRPTLARVIVLHMRPAAAAVVLRDAARLGMSSEGFAFVGSDGVIADPKTIQSVSTETTSPGMGLIAVQLEFPSTPASIDFNPFSNASVPSDRQRLSMYTSLVHDTVLLIAKAMENLTESQAKAISDYSTSRAMLNATCYEGRFPLGRVVQDRIRASTLQSGATGLVTMTMSGEPAEYKYKIVNLQYNGVLAKVGEVHSDGSVSVLEPIVWPGGTISITPPSDRPRQYGRLTMAMISQPPWTFIDADGNWDGYLVDLAKKLGEDIGFDLTYKLTPDGQYGAKINETTWTGVVNELWQGRADLAGAPLTITSLRSSIIRYSLPYIDTGYSMAVQGSPMRSSSFSTYSDVFTVDLWYLIFGSILVLSFTVGVIENKYFHGQRRQQQRVLRRARSINTPQPKQRRASRVDQVADQLRNWLRKEGKDLDNQFSSSNMLYSSMLLFTGDLGDNVPRSLPGRLVTVVFAITYMVLLRLYVASLAAKLAAAVPAEIAVSSVEDLNNLAITLGTLRNSAPEEYLTDELDVNNVEGRLELYDNASEAMQGLVAGDIDAFIFDDLIVQTSVTDHGSCNIVKLPEVWQRFTWGFGLGPNVSSALAEAIDTALVNYRSSGYLGRLQAKWVPDVPACNQLQQESAAFEPVKLGSLIVMFYALAGVLGVGLLLFGLELLVQCTSNTRHSWWTIASATSNNNNNNSVTSSRRSSWGVHHSLELSRLEERAFVGKRWSVPALKCIEEQGETNDNTTESSLKLVSV